MQPIGETTFVPPDDGYTLPGKVARFPGLYPEHRFRFRPATQDVRDQYNNAPPHKKTATGFAIVCQRVRDLRAVVDDSDPDDPKLSDPFVLRPENCRSLHAELYTQLLYTVIGLAGPDVEEMEKNCSGGRGSPSSTPPSPP
jgi:hypothetical protein